MRSTTSRWFWTDSGQRSCRLAAKERAGTSLPRLPVVILLGAGFELVEIHKLYGCLDLLIEHKQALSDHLTQQWKDLFNATFDALLYDLTSMYFESDLPFPVNDKRKYGYSRDKRFDCVQVVIALIVKPEGFPLAYEVMAGNTADNTTLQGFLKKIEAQYGKAERIWVMDPGIPTEEVLRQMRLSDPPVYYPVGTPKGRLSRYEKTLADKTWHTVRNGVDVKLLPQEDVVYVLAQSQDRIHKERSMRQRQLKGLWMRLHQLQSMQLTRYQLLLNLGAAKQQSPSTWRFVHIDMPRKLTFTVCFTQRSPAKCLAQGRSLSPPNKPHWPRPSTDVGVLYPVGACRVSI